ncbi:MAG: EAL domain-containing protein [Thermoanaerobaculia bacterium]|jgi:diguanylate cyclase (GGDEF)-like protein/PAS domain S-box-containing protein
MATETTTRPAPASLDPRQESALDGLLVVDAEGRVTLLNQRLREIFRLPVASPLPESEDAMLAALRPLVADWTPIRERQGDPGASAGKAGDLQLQDGRVLAVTVSPMDDAQPSGRVWYFRDVSERRRYERLQSALFRIAEIAHSALDLAEVYRSLHRVVGELMDATNFYIAIRDDKRKGIWFPYYVDAHDTRPEGVVPIEGLTGYILKKGDAILVDRPAFDRLVEAGEVTIIGTPPVDWMAAPLKRDGEPYGVICVQSYDESVRHSPQDLEILKFVSRHISAAIEARRKEIELAKSEENYRNIFKLAPVGIYQTSLEGRIRTANGTLARILGYSSPDDLLGLSMASDVYFDSAERTRLIEQYLPVGRAFDCEVVWKRRDGSPVWVQLNSHAVRGPQGEVMHFEGFVHDISGRKEAEEIMRTQAAAMEASMDGIAIVTAEGRLSYANRAFLKLFGGASDRDLIGYHWRVLIEKREMAAFLRSVIVPFERSGEWRGESSARTLAGMQFPVEISLTRIAARHTVCVIRDVTERNFAEEQIRHLAYHDALTGLPNRLLFRDRLAVAIPQCQRAGRRLAVLFLDLDRFKVVNDTLGHNAGDQLLQEVAARLKECVRESDTVARLGGDEFTLLIPMLGESDDASRLAQKLLESIHQPFDLDGRELFTTTSIGVSVFPEDGSDAGTLIRNADTAMYQAKEKGRNNYQLFNAELNSRSLERLAIENDLRRAITGHEFVNYYQPVIDLRNGRVSGMEALVRWQHPHLGLLGPGTFIPIAEGAGLMDEVGEIVLRDATRQARLWQLAGFRGLHLAVNLSARQLHDPDLPRRIDGILEETGLPPTSLTLEITESSAMQHAETSVRILEALKLRRIDIAVDDFGVGHSSLNYLKRFPVDILKIDQSFVHDISEDADTAAIVTGIIALGHKLRLSIIAEGVETVEQRDFLRNHDCDMVQGFLYSVPLPADAFEEFLRDSNEKTGQWSLPPRV